MKSRKAGLQCQNSSVTEAEADRFEAFVEDLRRRGRADKTVESYRSDWVGLRNWYGGRQGEPFELSAVDAALAAEWRDALAGAGMRPATVNRKLVFLKRYARWAAERGGYDPKACADVRSVEGIEASKRVPRALNDMELRRFLDTLESRGSARDRALVYMLLETGLRVSALVQLRLADLSVSARRATVTLEEGRGEAVRVRKASLGSAARRALQAYLALRGDGPGRLFMGERGPLTANAVQRVVRRCCEWAGVKVSPGTLRHTFAAAFLAEHGNDVVALADVLGHESLETTRLYLAGR